MRVLILVDEPKVAPNGKNGQHDKIDSLEALVAEIKSKPIDPDLIQPGDDLLAWRLGNPVTDPDPLFDEAIWNQE